jgi:conjugative relaxase-like TrwC/TraI family protein
MVVSVKAIGSASGAASYYAADNYYTASDTPEHQGIWAGEAAARLGLSGSVDAEAFENALKGHLPNGDVIANTAGAHRPGLDMTFSAPKSVSLLALLGKDDRIAPAHLAAVQSTLGWVEHRLAEARISSTGPRAVQTGNLAYALFAHDVSRTQDPQLHVHAVILNATQRPDGAWRSVHNDKLYEENTLIGAVYHAELRMQMQKLGYQTEIVGKHGSFEIMGVDQATINQWSTRRSDILTKAAELDIKTPQGLRAVAERTRDTKEIIEPAQLAAHWNKLAKDRNLDLSPLVKSAMEASRPRHVFEQVKAWGQALLDKVTHFFGPKPEPLMAGAEPAVRGRDLAAAYAVAAGVRHLSEREATFAPNMLLRSALNMSDHGATVREVEARINKLVDDRAFLMGTADRQTLLTTREILKTEVEMVDRVQAGVDVIAAPVDPSIAEARLKIASQAAGLTISAEQRAAALAIVSGTNAVHLIQGDAGAGKTTLFALARDVAAQSSIEMIAATPQNKLAAELRAQTSMPVTSVEGLLSKYGMATDKPNGLAINRAQAELGGKILIIDEASMVSHRQMVGLLRLAERSGLAKLVLVGDIKQIDPVEAGRPFALLQNHKAPTEYLSENRRQRDPELRSAVAMLKAGDVGGALDVLGDRVKEGPSPAKAAAQQWLSMSDKEREATTLLTSGHALRQELLTYVRNGLIAEGKLGAQSLTLHSYDNLNLTTQQLKQLSTYMPGQQLEVFRYQPSIDLSPGRYVVRGVDHDNQQVMVAKEGVWQSFNPQHLSSSAKGLALKVPASIDVRKGDRLIWTSNNKAKAITNGTQVGVLKLDANGLTVGNDKREWPISVGNPLSQSLAHGRVLNMHRAQGMTFDRTIAVIDSHDRLLNSASLFYVLNSRAREDSAIHLDNKEAVARSIESHRGATPNALDLSPEIAASLLNTEQRTSPVDQTLAQSLAKTALSILGIKDTTSEPVIKSSPIPYPQKQLSEPVLSKSRDFDMGM